MRTLRWRHPDNGMDDDADELGTKVVVWTILWMS